MTTPDHAWHDKDATEFPTPGPVERMRGAIIGCLPASSFQTIRQALADLSEADARRADARLLHRRHGEEVKAGLVAALERLDTASRLFSLDMPETLGMPETFGGVSLRETWVAARAALARAKGEA